MNVYVRITLTVNQLHVTAHLMQDVFIKVEKFTVNVKMEKGCFQSVNMTLATLT